MNDRLNRLEIHPTVRLEEARAAIRERGQRLFDFGIGDPREPTPEFVRQALIDAVPEVSGYSTSHGKADFREAAADWMRRRFGVTFDAEREVLATAGSKEAIFHLPMIFVDADSPRNLVVFGEPGYAAFRIGATFAGAVEHPVPLGVEDRYVLTPEAVGDDVLARTAIVFLNYPHNPSGQEMPPEVFQHWVEARDRHGFLLVSDEVYVDLYLGEPPHSLLEYGRDGCLAVHSLSKRSGMTGYMTGFLAGDEDLIASLKKHRAGMGVSSPPWIQAAGTAAWRDDAHVESRRVTLGEKQRVMAEVLEARGLSIYPTSSALFMWAEIPNGNGDDVAYAARLAKQGIVVAPGTLFGASQDHFVRLALAPSLEACREAAALWP